MLIAASQRGGGGRLAAHLLNANDNEHIEIAEVSGFVSETLAGAMREAYALSKGTRCKQHLFSVTINPPKGATVPLAVFEDVIDRIEERLKLAGQPRMIVYHEKKGRRHAHVVWSRIDTDKMRAVNMSFFKERLFHLSKELFLEQGWKLPEGYIDRTRSNPLNYSTAEMKQAKRLGDNPKQIRAVLRECWMISDNKKSFAQALERKGYYLAKGDRRGFVAVDWRGEVHSLSRKLKVNAENLQARLGNPDDLPSVQQVNMRINAGWRAQIQKLTNDLKLSQTKAKRPLLAQRDKMRDRHRRERLALQHKQDQRRTAGQHTRRNRFRKGVMGLWDRLNGQHSRIQAQNEQDVLAAWKRDRKEKDHLIEKQLSERSTVQKALDTADIEHEQELQQLHDKLFKALPEDRRGDILMTEQHTPTHERDYGPTLL